MYEFVCRIVLELVCSVHRSILSTQLPVSWYYVHNNCAPDCRIMREYMPKVGTLGHDMMFRSTTIQVSSITRYPVLPWPVHLARSPALPCSIWPLLSSALQYPSCPVPACPCSALPGPALRPALLPAALPCSLPCPAPVLPCLYVSCLIVPLPFGSGSALPFPALPCSVLPSCAKYSCHCPIMLYSSYTAPCAQKASCSHDTSMLCML